MAPLLRLAASSLLVPAGAGNGGPDTPGGPSGRMATLPGPDVPLLLLAGGGAAGGARGGGGGGGACWCVCGSDSRASGGSCARRQLASKHHKQAGMLLLPGPQASRFARAARVR